MKNLIPCILTLLLIPRAYPGGGVTVGNGHGQVFVGLNLGGFEQKELILKKANKIKKMIKVNKHPQIQAIKKQGQCQDNYAKIVALDENSFYKIKDGLVIPDLKHYGHMRVELKGCKKIKYMSAEEPYGGRELWDLQKVPRTFNNNHAPLPSHYSNESTHKL